MSLVNFNFQIALLDVKTLIQLYNTFAQPKKPDKRVEVLRRAALVFTITAWETFIEEIITEQFNRRLDKAQSPTDVLSTFNSIATDTLNSQSNLKKFQPPDLLAWTGDGWKTILKRKFASEITNFHTPNSSNIRHLSKRYLDVDITSYWKWPKTSTRRACYLLDRLIVRRGLSVHNAKGLLTKRRIVTMQTVIASYKLVKQLVTATEEGLGLPAGHFLGV